MMGLQVQRKVVKHNFAEKHRRYFKIKIVNPNCREILFCVKC